VRDGADVFWSDGNLKLIDQRRRRQLLSVASFSSCGDVARAIGEMVVRGAPAIGVAAAFGSCAGSPESSAASARDLMAIYGGAQPR
jgi:methylthioribose-1-phosphate isomerase